MERDPVTQLLQPVRVQLDNDNEDWERVSRPGSSASLTWVALPGTPVRSDSPWISAGTGQDNPWDGHDGVLPTGSLSPSPVRVTHRCATTLDEEEVVTQEPEPESSGLSAAAADFEGQLPARTASPPVQEDSFQSTSAASDAHQHLPATLEDPAVTKEPPPAATAPVSSVQADEITAAPATTQQQDEEEQQHTAVPATQQQQASTPLPATPPSSPSHKRRPFLWRFMISVPLLSVVFSTLLCVVATTLMAQRSRSRSKTCSATAAADASNKITGMLPPEAPAVVAASPQEVAAA